MTSISTKRKRPARQPSPVAKLEALKRWGSVVCAKCRVSTCVDLVEWDHIVPWALSKDSRACNIQPLCAPCHHLKTNGPKHVKVDGDKSKIAKAVRLSRGGKKSKTPFPKLSEPQKASQSRAAQRVESEVEVGGTDMKIATPGLYDISFEDYFSDLCPSHSVSSTGLKIIEQKSLAHYWHASYLNPHREPHDTAALAFGRACHSWILGEPVFNQYFVISPHEAFRTKEARVWRDTQTRTIVSAGQLEQIKAMAASLQRDKLLRNVFIDGLPERSLVWQDRETGLWLKSRPDWLPNTLRLVPDFKTCATAKPESFAKAAFGLGYHMSAALCLDGLKEVLGWTNAAYYFVAQEKDPPHVAIPFTMRDEDIEMGRLLNRSALRKLANALDRNHWPAYATGAVEITMPAWSEKTFLDRHAAGEFEPKHPEEELA